MTIETLNAIKAEAEGVYASVNTLNGKLNEYENASGELVPDHVNTAWTELTISLDTILSWVNQAIEDGTVEEPEMQVMAAFLAELKLVFEKYSATLRIIESADGYGLDYGGSGAENVIQFTVSRDGTTEVKDFIQTSLIAADLI